MRPSIRKGLLLVITGPMFSGKTSRLLELLERDMIAGRKISLFKPKIDSRYSEGEVVTHKGIRLPATVVSIDSEGVKRIENDSANSQVIGVDEAQFWPPDSGLPKALDRLAFHGKIIYVSLLNRDHRGDPFGSSMELLARADEVQSLNAVCARCGDEAYLTQRLNMGREVFGEQVRIGGKELYEPRCRACYIAPSHF